MAHGALKQITTRAKQIYRKGGTWKTAIKKAGAEYRGKKKTKKRRKVSGTLSSGGPSGYSIGKVKRRRKVSGTLSDSPRPAGYSIGGLSAAHFISKAKEKLNAQIGHQYVRIMNAKTKLLKRRLAKKLSELKSKYRKLC